MTNLTKLAREVSFARSPLLLMLNEVHVHDYISIGSGLYKVLQAESTLPCNGAANCWPLVPSFRYGVLKDFWLVDSEVKYRQESLLCLLCDGFCVQLVGKGRNLWVKMLGWELTTWDMGGSRQFEIWGMESDVF